MSGESDLYFHQLPVGQMANLAYLIGSRSTRQALVVDPAWSVDALLDQAETDGAPATFLALLCSFGMLARGVARHVENVETSACMEGEPAGWLAEAGRSLGQPAACFFSSTL